MKNKKWFIDNNIVAGHYTNKDIQVEVDKIRKTLLLINEYLYGDYRIIKTYRGTNPRIGNDVDVLVEKGRFGWTRWLFESIGFKAREFNQVDRDIGLYKDGYKKIHLHGAIRWCEVDYMDDEFIWENPLQVMYLGERITIPNYEADFLIHIAHINYEEGCVRLSEYTYYCALLNLITEAPRTQAYKYHWGKTYDRTVKILDSSFPEAFPLTLSRRHLIHAMVERGLYKYTAKRFWKVLRILLTGNTRRYLDAPERKMI